MTPIRILLLDDKASMEQGTFKRWFGRSFRRLSPGLMLDWADPIDDLASALEALEDSKAKVDLVLVDAHWSAIGPGELTEDDDDATTQLVRAAARREACVVMLVSRSAATLLEHIYETTDNARSPDSVVYKQHLKRDEVLDAAVAAAFSAAREPLRSRGKSIGWDLDSTDPVPTAETAVALAELTALTCGAYDEVKFAPVSGGLSDTLTFFATPQTDRDGRRQIATSRMVKLARDEAVLRAEMAAHRHIVQHFPEPSFASIVSPLKTFGGWHALAFERVDGAVTASKSLDSVQSEKVWQRLFSDQLRNMYVSNADAEASYSPYEVVFGAEGKFAGLLAGDRLVRLVREMKATGAEDGTELERKDRAESLFSRERRFIPMTIAHGDLHTRNVLVRPNETVLFVDAASASFSHPWMDDVARFTAWLACERVAEDVQEGHEPTALVKSVRVALGLDRRVIGPRPWARQLRHRVDETKLDMASRWAARETPVKVDVDGDWNFGVQAELLRAVYMIDMFDSVTRRIACQAALLSD